jgi:hypothetical protein
VTGATDVFALLHEAAKRGTVFIGVVVPKEHRAVIAEAFDDAATEAASVVLAKKFERVVMGLGLARAAISRRSPSASSRPVNLLLTFPARELGPRTCTRRKRCSE